MNSVENEMNKNLSLQSIRVLYAEEFINREQLIY